MSEPEQTPPAAGEEDAPRDPMKRRIAVTLATVVLLGASLAIAQTDASVHESNTAREATRAAVRALRANVAVNTVQEVRSGVAAERDTLPFRTPLIPSGPTLLSAAGLRGNSGETTHETAVAGRALQKVSGAEPLGRLRFTAAADTLQQRALATTRITWNTRSTQYTTVIAVLAVALFLLGFGLVVDGQLRRVTYLFGVGVAVFVAVWAAWIFHLSIPHTPVAAISADARGSAMADAGNDRGAVAAYDRALAVDPDNAAAYTGRSRARLLIANPDYPVSRAFTDVDGRASRIATADAERALELDGRGDVVSYALVAIDAFYTGQYARAVERADGALEINPGVPDVLLLRSAARLAQGDGAGAISDLHRAVSALHGSEPSQRTRALASAYLSYLSWVAWKVPERAHDAKRLADQVVEIETSHTLNRTVSGALPAQGGVEVDGLRYAAGRLSFVLRWHDLPAGTALSAIGYEQALPDGAFSQPPALALFVTLAGSGSHTFSVPLPRICHPVAVRADLYLNGAAALSRTGPGGAATC